MPTIKTTEFQTRINTFFSSVRDRAAAVSIIDFGQLFEQLKETAVREATALMLEGYAKKQLVMDALAQFIDAYLPLPWWLSWARSYIKSFLLAIADGSIEAIYERIKIEATPKMAVKTETAPVVAVTGGVT